MIKNGGQEITIKVRKEGNGQGSLGVEMWFICYEIVMLMPN